MSTKSNHQPSLSRLSQHKIANPLRNIDPKHATLALSLILGLFFCAASQAQTQPPVCTSTYTAATGNIIAMPNPQYMLQNDEWGQAGDGSSQPPYLESICRPYSDSSQAWWANWNWSPGTQNVKAYPSIWTGWNFDSKFTPGSGFPVILSAGNPIPASVDFSMSDYGTNGPMKYDTSFDMFLNNNCAIQGGDWSCTNKNGESASAEVMVWLSEGQSTPSSSKLFNANMHLGGVSGTWSLYIQEGGSCVCWPLYQFVATTPVTSFGGNLQPFLYYLLNNYKPTNPALPAPPLPTDYLMGVQFGSEVWWGEGGITVNNFTATAK